MLRLATLSCLLLLSSMTTANQSAKLFQVDVILFLHQQAGSSQVERNHSPLVAPNMNHAIPLKTESDTISRTYHLLPASASHLRQEYWTLQHNPAYQVLLSYSWLQPSSNLQAVAMPLIVHQGWRIEGLLSVRQGQYYAVDTELLCSAPNEQDSFLFSQKQRLKPSTVYYFDHPQAGMLMSVHRVT